MKRKSIKNFRLRKKKKQKKKKNWELLHLN